MGSELRAADGDVTLDAWVADESLRVEPDEEEEAVVSRIYSITSHVCRVASGANDTLRCADDAN